MTTTTVASHPAATEPTQRITLDLPAETHRTLKIFASASGRSMKDVILEALRVSGVVPQQPLRK
ncbi:MAG: hypothetical protein O3A14_17545, partial [Cyanobacteria bacterium]|nr:hypothetical protein [Cyanobacteriota bacterium]